MFRSYLLSFLKAQLHIILSWFTTNKREKTHLLSITRGELVQSSFVVGVDCFVYSSTCCVIHRYFAIENYQDIIGGIGCKGIESELEIGSIGGSGGVGVLMSELRWRRWCKNSFHS